MSFSLLFEGIVIIIVVFMSVLLLMLLTISCKSPVGVPLILSPASWSVVSTLTSPDDSGSMSFEEGGERIKDLRLILERVASIATVFDEDGISMRFMNANYDIAAVEHIRTEQQIERLMSTVQFKGLTPMGTELRRKVIDGIIMPKIQRRQ